MVLLAWSVADGRAIQILVLEVLGEAVDMAEGVQHLFLARTRHGAQVVTHAGPFRNDVKNGTGRNRCQRTLAAADCAV